MGCFAAVAVEAAIVSKMKKKAEEEEKKVFTEEGKLKVQSIEVKISLSKKLDWLKMLLWGGTFLLVIEHIWHGEVVPWFPFLTAMENPEDIGPIIWEIVTVGGAMVVFVTAVWYMGTKMADYVYREIKAGRMSLTARK